MSAAVEIRDLSFSYPGAGDAVFEDACLAIEEGVFAVLAGPTGSGKTTLLRLLKPEIAPMGAIAGERRVFGRDVAELTVRESAETIAFVFQDPANQIVCDTVWHELAFGLENLKWPKDRIRKRVDEMLAMLKIEQFEKRYPSELSGGQQQRVAIARTLAPEPKVLFMDEPLSNLDAKLRLEMRTELKRLHAETDSTFVYVTHDQLEAMTLATRICLMKDGVLQQYDPPLEVYNNPANLFVADFVGNPTMNFLPGTARILDETHAEVTVLGRSFLFESDAPLGKPEGEDVVLGVRPEFIRLGSGGMEGKVYAALPAGMETTVQMTMGDQLVTSVEFGSVDYKANSPMRFEFHGQGLILFDKKSGKKLGRGSATQR